MDVAEEDVTVCGVCGCECELLCGDFVFIIELLCY